MGAAPDPGQHHHRDAHGPATISPTILSIAPSPISVISSRRTPGRPFFTYLALGAAHAPLHAPKEYIDKYKGKFDQGWTRSARRRSRKTRKKAQYYEMLGSRAMWADGWTAVTWHKKDIAVGRGYNGSCITRDEDFTETNNLAAQNPAKARKNCGPLPGGSEEVQRPPAGLPPVRAGRGSHAAGGGDERRRSTPTIRTHRLYIHWPRRNCWAREHSDHCPYRRSRRTALRVYWRVVAASSAAGHCS